MNHLSEKTADLESAHQAVETQNSKHFLIVTCEVGGNVPPILGLANRLVKKGHTVSLLSEPCLEEVAKQTGLNFVPFKQHFTRTNRTDTLLDDWKSKGRKANFNRLLFGPMKVTAEETSDAISGLDADVLLVDCLMPGALFAGEAKGIPTVIIQHMPEHLPSASLPPGAMGVLPGRNPLTRFRDRILSKRHIHQLDRQLPLVNQIRANFQLPVVTSVVDLFHGCNKRLIQTCRAFDFPIEPAPDNVVYTGPVLDDPDFVEPWTNLCPEDDKRPLIVVSLSTTFQNQKNTLENIICALNGLKARALITVGPAMEPKDFAANDNIKVVNTISHSQVFPEASLVITHCGHGTVMRALACGVPLLGLPMGRDQNGNATKISHHRVGLKLMPDSGPDQIRRATLKILSQTHFKQNAQRLQREILATKNQDLAIATLEQLASKEIG